MDLFIRTSGEQRASNFLISQAAYAEYVFQDKLWPDYDRRDLWAACEEYVNRNRRFEANDALRWQASPDRLVAAIAEALLPVTREDDGAVTVHHDGTFASLRVVSVGEGLDMVSLEPGAGLGSAARR